MADKKKYVELLWAEKYDKLVGDELAVICPSLPFRLQEKGFWIFIIQRT